MTQRAKIITGGLIFVAAIMFFFLVLGGGTGLYFLTSWLAADKRAITEQKEETKKEETKKEDFSSKEKSTTSTQEEKSQPIIKAMLQTPQGDLIDFPTEMKGSWGVCMTKEGKVRTYGLKSLESHYRSTHPKDTTFIRGDHTDDTNIEVQYEGDYFYVDGKMTPGKEVDMTDRKTTKTTLNWVIQFWHKTGHFPALPIEAHSLNVKNHPEIVRNRPDNGWTFSYTIVMVAE